MLMIDDHQVVLTGFVAPIVSNIKIDFAEIEEIEAVKLKPLARLNVLGTQNLKTWWIFDPMRPFKKQGFVMTIHGGRFKIGFTASDFHSAFRVLAEKLGPRFHDRRYK
jgi:hypothetical protein